MLLLRRKMREYDPKTPNDGHIATTQTCSSVDSFHAFIKRALILIVFVRAILKEL